MQQVGKIYNFKRSLRIRKKEDFQCVYKTGKCFVDYAGIFYVFSSNSAKPSRIGVAAGKKLGNAVLRNRIKRLMRESYRHNKFKVAPGFDIVWIARQPLKNATTEFFVKNFIKLCKKANIFLSEQGEKDKCKNSL